ncbi:MAG: elongation factor 1-beta [Thermoproteota archaeon]|nr:elongation factor 1-beta [Thermoproteota archaeon]
MGKVVVTYKIFPIDIDVNFDKLKQTVQKQLPKYAKIYGYATEPIAYGLNALIAHIILPENMPGALEQLEQTLQNLKEISQIQPIMVRKTR